MHKSQDSKEVCCQVLVSHCSMPVLFVLTCIEVKVIEMKAVVFQKYDGEQNLRREIRNMEA